MVPLVLFMALLPLGELCAQPVLPYKHPVQRGSAELLEQIRQLQVLGGALFVAAHPDDENTRMIAWLAGERKVQTTYISLTRGDGGQNLIGPELAELLGVLRTQELLRARGIDRGEQLFTRANDFGYSKHPDETLEIWDREEVLSDMVWAIRKLRPDVIINRFDHRSSGTTHGHHTASAILALEAFELAADPRAFPEQLAFAEPWQAARIFFNTSWWFYGSREAFAKADKSQLISIDPGTYQTARGLSYSEIAAHSRSMHRCQGFGSTGARGSEPEYLEWLGGIPMPATESASGQAGEGALSAAQDPFSGLDLSWSRVAGGQAVEEALLKAETAFDINQPHLAVPALMEAYRLMEAVQEDPRVRHRRELCADLIRQCLGLWFEATVPKAQAVPGDSLSVQAEWVVRSPQVLTLEVLELLNEEGEVIQRKPLSGVTAGQNESIKKTLNIRIANDAPFSTAYWLREEPSLGLFKVEEQELRGLPESPRPFYLRAIASIDGQPIVWKAPLVHTYNDPVRGQVYEPFELLPPAAVRTDQPVYLFPSDAARPLRLLIKANRDGVRGVLRAKAENGWEISDGMPFDIAKKGEQIGLDLMVRPPQGNQSSELRLVLEIDGVSYPWSMLKVDYEHIPAQTILKPAKARLSRLDLELRSHNIGYVMGAGDDIPQALREIGCTVTLLDDAFFAASALDERLQAFDAIVAGIRAYNTREQLPLVQEALMRYVQQGGTYLVQYNTQRPLLVDQIGPYPFVVSRERVTREDAPVTLLQAAHPALSQPNQITEEDFDGWIQERGLYFASSWDEAYTPLLSSHDPEEDPRQGGLLVAQYGKGWFAFSGYSFFRQLPAGVPGAFRLFANLISLGR